MKKFFGSLFSVILLLPLLTSCGKYDYFAHVSDLRSDIFFAETDLYSLSVYCVERESPFLCDGVASPRVRTVEVILVEKERTGAEFEVYFLSQKDLGGDMSFRSVSGDFYYSKSVLEFPEKSVSLRVVRNGEQTDLVATSVKGEGLLTPEQALSHALEAEQREISRLTYGGAFHGELHVRLLKRDKTYYYVGIVDETGEIRSLLLDSESGEVLAKRGK